MASTSLTFKLFGQDVSAGKTMRDVGKTASGVAAGMGAAWAASKLVDFAKDSLNAFGDLGRQTMGLKRYLGSSAEEASRLGHAFAMTGTDTDTATKSLGILSKHLTANDKAAQNMGVAYRDSSGKMLPMHDVLLGLSEKLRSMPDGAEKTALAMSTLGRGGAAMIPFLNRGAEGIRELESESDALGTTLSGKDLDAVKENTAAKRKFGEAIKGLQVTLGRELYPVLTMVASFLSDKVVPVIRAVVEWIKENKTVVLFLAGAIGTIVTALKVWAIAQAALNFVMAMNPIMLIVYAVAAIIAALVLAYQKVDWFRNFIDTVFAGIKVVVGGVVDFFQTYVWPVVKWIFEAWWTYVSTLWKVVSTVFGWIWHSAIEPFVNWWRDTVWPIIRAVIGFIVDYYTTLWNVVSTVFKWIWENAIQPFVNWFRDTAWPIIRVVIEAIKKYYEILWAAIKFIWDQISGRVSAFVSFFRERVAPPIAAIASAIGGYFSGLWGTVRSVWDWIVAKISSVVNWFGGVKEAIGNKVSGMWNGIADAFRSAINTVIRIWNGLEFGIPSFTAFGKTIGGFTVGTPNIPLLAQGGIVTGPTLAVIGEAGPEAVIPLSQGGRYGVGSGGVVINVYGPTDPQGAALAIQRALVDYKNRTGQTLGLA